MERFLCQPLSQLQTENSVVSGIDDIDGTIFMNADAVRAQQTTSRFFDTAAQNTGKCATAWIVEPNTFVLVVGDNNVVIRVNGDMLG